MMANRTLAENVAQAKADFKGVKDALVAQVDYDLSGVPTSEYGNKVNAACIEMYGVGKEDGKMEGYENGKSDGISEGFAIGKGEGLQEGIEQGRQAQYDEFWDSHQNYGKRTDYAYGFAGEWNDKTFAPKYDMIPVSCTNTFYYCNIGNLEEILNNCGVVLDTSKVTNITYGFGYSTITHIPVVNLSKATTTTYLFANFGNTSTLFSRNRLVSIRKIISSEITVFANTTFSGTYHLEHCIFEGTIASNINMQWSIELNYESATSALICLKNFTGTDGAYTKTIVFASAVWELLASYGNAATNPNTGEPCTWEEYIDAKGWEKQ